MSYKAFVSPTFVDLKDHRARVIVALRKAGIHVDPMEEWSAGRDEPKRLSVERMRDCDLCILLVGARRGHIPENEILSITQMEVHEAVKRGIDVLAFLYDGESPWLPAHYELNSDEELKRWRAELKEHQCAGSFTCDPATLDSPVRDAISRWLQRQSWPEVHKTYLETLRDAHASIRFLGVGHYKDIQDRPIEDLFVDPCTAAQHISPDTPPEKWPETSPLFALVSSDRRIVLLGDPGSGKSTLVSWIVWNLARDGENRWKQAMNSRTPLVMVLRELSLDRVRSWDDLLAAYCKHWTARLLGRSRYAPEMRQLLEDGRAMIILDGLDEVGNPQVQESLRQAVWEGMRKYEDCAWLLTSRLVGYLGYHEGPSQETPNGGDGRPISYAQLRYIAPFADDQIKKFARNWFTSRDLSALRASEDAGRLIEAIHSNPYTLRLARTPNLLTMMALIHRERARLPHGRALLYTDIANAYLQSIDEHRRIEHLGYTLRDQKQWLGRIGFEMQLRRHRSSGQSGKDEEKEILVAGREVRQWVVQAMRDGGRTDSNEEAANAFLDEICRRSGLLLPRGEDQFAFTHLSFQEFFAALFFVPQFMRPTRRAGSKETPGAGHEDLHAYGENPMWHETLVFLVELLFAEHPPEWIEELLFCLFGEGFSEVAPRPNRGTFEDEQQPTADPQLSQSILLARLAVNPHTGLTERGLKSAAIAHCCTFAAGEQKRLESKIADEIRNNSWCPVPETFRVLLGAEQEELPQVSQIFADALQDAKVESISFCRTPVDDLSPFVRLSGLRALDLSNSNVTDLSPLPRTRGLKVLDLHGTRASDVTPLAALSGLQSLYLHNTPVSEVTPLAALTGLQSLNLSGTQVCDVKPLAALTGLQLLYLNDTQVCDVKPLAALTGLQLLYLNDTQVSDSDLRNLQEALPQCKIAR
jgi:internalin A